MLRDIVQPSVAINPDRIAYTIELKSGDALSGMILDDSGDRLVIGDAAGTQRTLAKSDVAAMRASPVSLMPDNLWQNLTPAQQRDLMTYLLTEPKP